MYGKGKGELVIHDHYAKILLEFCIKSVFFAEKVIFLWNLVFCCGIFQFFFYKYFYIKFRINIYREYIVRENSIRLWNRVLNFAIAC